MSTDVVNQSTCVTATPVAAATDALTLLLPSPPTLPVNTQPSSTVCSVNPNTQHGKRSQTNGNNNNSHKNKRRKRGKQHQAPPPKAPLGCSVCKVVKENDPPKYKCPKCRASYCSVACCRQHKAVCPGKESEISASTNSTGTIKTGTSSSACTLAQAPTLGNLDTNDDSEIDSDDDDDDSSLDDGWKITDDMKNALRNSTWLRTELQDGGLRDMIASVVRSERKSRSFHRKQEKYGKKSRHLRKQQPRHPDEELATKRAENRNFDIFNDKLLVLADVLERKEGPKTFENGEFCSSILENQSNRNEEELEEWLRLKWNPGMAPPVLALRPRKRAIPKFEPVDVSSSEDEDEDKDESE